jgi:hypothetical protein
MPPRLAALLLPLPLLAACASTGAATSPGASVPTPVRTPVRRTPPPAAIQALPGTEGVIGTSRADLLRQFGPARLDVWEGDARKLQWTGQACVLDVYLYPKSAGAEPQATYVDARRPSDGRDVDRAACINALRKQ